MATADYLWVTVHSSEKIGVSTWCRGVNKINLRAPGGYAISGKPKRARESVSDTEATIKYSVTDSISVMHLTISGNLGLIRFAVASCAMDVLKATSQIKGYTFVVDHTGCDVDRVTIESPNRFILSTCSVGGKREAIEDALGCEYSYNGYSENYHLAALLAKYMKGKYRTIIEPDPVYPHYTLPEPDYMQKKFAQENINANPAINANHLYIGKSILSLPNGYEWFHILDINTGSKLYLAKNSKDGSLINPLGLLGNFDRTPELSAFLRDQAATYTGISSAYMILSEVYDDVDNS